MRGETYPERLDNHLQDSDYSLETVNFIHRACRVGRVSEQFVLDMLQQVELDIVSRQSDKVFGAIPTPEVFADAPRLFDVDL